MKGFSGRNLAYMRAFAAAWPKEQTLQQAVAQLPWGHITVLLDRLDDHELRDWYAAQAAAHGSTPERCSHEQHLDRRPQRTRRHHLPPTPRRRPIGRQHRHHR